MPHTFHHILTFTTAHWSLVIAVLLIVVAAVGTLMDHTPRDEDEFPPVP